MADNHTGNGQIGKNGREEINERLHEAIDGLRKDVTRVEIWATALGTFSQPVPEYRPDPKFTLNGQTNTENIPGENVAANGDETGLK